MEMGLAFTKILLHFTKRITDQLTKKIMYFCQSLKIEILLIKIFKECSKQYCVKPNLNIHLTEKKRSVYSLRHTAISFRLLMGDVDAYTLARNARTSTEVIERFYASTFQISSW